MVGDSIYHKGRSTWQRQLPPCRGPPAGRFVPLPSAHVYTTAYHDRTGENEAVHQERRRRDDGAAVRGEGVEGGATYGSLRRDRHGDFGDGDGAALSSDERVKDILLRCQHDMFTAATELAVDPDHYDLLIENFSPVTEGMVERLERWIDALDDEVDLPPRFIVPGASASSGAIDLARTLTRDAERRIVALSETEPPKNDNVLRYVNRLSDLLFILARYEDRDLPFEITTGEMRRDAEQ